MTLLEQILAWSDKDLAPWQRDALRRLFVSGTGKLTTADYDDLLALLKSNGGLPDPKNRVAIPLSTLHLPSPATVGSKVSLIAMRDLTDVNRIASKQVLQFASSGMTVIYGGNGSGKSGYSRVLKRACRARDIDEKVYPDLTSAATTPRIPQATFDIDVGGTQLPIAWKQDEPAPDMLSGIAVFDARCARSYLDEENDVAFLPYGLSIVESLGRDVMPAIATKLDAEIAAVNVDVSPFSDLVGTTVAGQICANLSATNDLEVVTKAGTLSKVEAARFAELNKAIAEPDPSTKAKGLRQSAQRLIDLATRIQDKTRWVSDEAVANAKTFDDSTQLAVAAQEQAAIAFRTGDTLLTGTGEPLWKGLLAAAEQYSAAAYPNKSFPHVHEGAQCVLCQQPLAEDASDRLQRFTEYVKRDVAKQASAKVEERMQKRQKLANAALDFGISEALVDELTEIDPVALQAAQAAEAAVEARRQWLLERLTQHDWTPPPKAPNDPVTLLGARASELVVQANELDKLADPAARKAILAEQAELMARDKLRVRLQPILDLIRRMKDKAHLVKCRKTIMTKPVSDKAKGLASSQVTAALKAALDKEFAALGVGHVKTKLKERVEQGAMKHKLILDLPTIADISEVLSEGEQRSIAIGAFLAELSQAGHTGGIVFDDPVSSLDHHRRLFVAQRLVAEAAYRQVIIFTHDTVFLGELQALMKVAKTSHTIHHLEWEGDKPGNVRDGLPWDHMGYKQRMAYHDQAQRKLAQSWPVYPNAEQSSVMRHEYSLLRATVERVVEDVILDGTIRRYREQIEAGKLDSLALLQKEDCNEIKRIYQFCHNVVDAHDSASGKAKPVPTADQLGKDIANIQAVIDNVLANRQAGTA